MFRIDEFGEGELTQLIPEEGGNNGVIEVVVMIERLSARDVQDTEDLTRTQKVIQ